MLFYTKGVANMEEGYNNKHPKNKWVEPEETIRRKCSEGKHPKQNDKDQQLRAMLLFGVEANKAK
jgi:hypothetical protein